MTEVDGLSRRSHSQSWNLVKIGSRTYNIEHSSKGSKHRLDKDDVPISYAL